MLACFLARHAESCRTLCCHLSNNRQSRDQLSLHVTLRTRTASDADQLLLLHQDMQFPLQEQSHSLIRAAKNRDNTDMSLTTATSTTYQLLHTTTSTTEGVVETGTVAFVLLKTVTGTPFLATTTGSYVFPYTTTINGISPVIASWITTTETITGNTNSYAYARGSYFPTGGPHKNTQLTPTFPGIAPTSNHLSSGAVAGLTIGVSFGILILLFIGLLFCAKNLIIELVGTFGVGPRAHNRRW